MAPVTRSAMKNSLKSSAGKRQFNEAHFDEAATKYDWATRALSLGQDPGWKKGLIAQLPDHPAPTCLDLACGTGDITFGLAQRYPQGEIIGLDLSAVMLSYAQQRNTYENIQFKRADMCRTDLPAESMDLVTGGYALRNAPDLNAALVELFRVMRPGATAAFLDFSKSPHRFCQLSSSLLLSVWGRCWGFVLHRNSTVHGYIAESLKTFPDRVHLQQKIHQHGFVHLTSQRHFLGLTETFMFTKPLVS